MKDRQQTVPDRSCNRAVYRLDLHVHEGGQQGREDGWDTASRVVVLQWKFRTLSGRGTGMIVQLSWLNSFQSNPCHLHLAAVCMEALQLHLFRIRRRFEGIACFSRFLPGG